MEATATLEPLATIFEPATTPIAGHDYSRGPNVARDIEESLNAARGIIFALPLALAFWVSAATVSTMLINR